MNSTFGTVRLSHVLLPLGSALLTGIAAISPLEAYAQASSDVDEGTIRVTLLGVGGGPRGGHFGIQNPVEVQTSTLVEIEGKAFLFDAGRGVLEQISKLGGDYFSKVDRVYLTHLHGDHNIGLPDLWLTPIRVPEGGRAVPLQVFGPAGTEEMAHHIASAFEYNLFYNGTSSSATRLIGVDIQQGIVYEEDGVTITAFDVDHSPGNIALEDRANYPALGFRVDYAGRSVAISGDTRFSENLIAYSEGVDVLIHEVGGGGMGGGGMGGGGMGGGGMGNHHTSIPEAGEIFSRVQPKLAVYSHFIRGDNQGLIEQTRDVYDGALLVGTEMTVITIGESIEVSPGNDDPTTSLQPAVGEN